MLKFNLSKNLHRIIILSFLLTFNSLYSQTQYADSLKNILISGDTEAQLSALCDLAMFYSTTNSAKALDYAFQQEKKAMEEKETTWLADAYENMGIIYFYSNNIDSALYYFVKATTIWSQEKNQKKEASTRLNIGTMYRYKMQYDSALFYFQKSLNYFESVNEEENASQVYANMAGVYNDMKNNEKHDEYTLKALEIQERAGSGVSMGISLVNLCMSYEIQNKFEEALNYGIRAVEVFRKVEAPYYLCRALIRTSSVMIETEDKRGLDYLNEALEIAEELDIDILKSETLRIRARYYMKTGKNNLAKTDVNNALAIADTTNKGDLMLFYNLLLEISILNNDHEDAMRYFRKFQNINTEILEQNWTEKISEMEIKYETEKKELKITTLEQRNAMIIRTSVLSGVILTLLLAFFVLRHRLAVHKRKLAEQEIIQIRQEKELADAQAEYHEEIIVRTELATDLNSVLENKLSDLQISMNDLKSGKNIVKEEVKNLNSMLNTIEESITDLRKLAHNMMPNSEKAKINKPLYENINTGLKELLENQEIYLKHDLRLDALSKMLATNKSYVSIVINEVYNTNFYTLLNRYRIKKAVELLNDDKLQIKDVWIQSGFNSQSAFNAMFQKEMGITPMEWKKKSFD